MLSIYLLFLGSMKRERGTCTINVYGVVTVCISVMHFKLGLVQRINFFVIVELNIQCMLWLRWILHRIVSNFADQKVDWY